MAKFKKGRRHERSDRDEESDHENDRRGGGSDWRARMTNKSAPTVTAMTQGQKKYIIEINNHSIIFCLGPAGTGKTAIAVGMALQHIMAPKPTYDKLVIMRPAKEACEEKMGFLPGDLGEKMGPWAAPIIDNMGVFIDHNAIKNLFFHRRIDIVPLAYARGRSLNNAFIILDEAQNCSPQQMLMALTRIGRDSKMIINGDIAQSDHRGKSGLMDAIERLEGMGGVSVVRLGESDIVRNPLIGEILKRYES